MVSRQQQTCVNMCILNCYVNVGSTNSFLTIDEAVMMNVAVYRFRSIQSA